MWKWRVEECSGLKMLEETRNKQWFMRSLPELQGPPTLTGMPSRRIVVRKTEIQFRS